VIALALALALATPPPTYLVERVITSAGQERRVSVFRDGTVVLAISGKERAEWLARQHLQPAEMQVLGQVINESYDELRRGPFDTQAPGDAWVELRLAPPGRDPLIVRYPLAGVAMQPEARVSQALDQLDKKLSSGPPDRENLDTWMPRVGERVLMDDGQPVEILDVSQGPTGPVIEVRLDDGPATMFFTLDELRRRAVRRLKP
jgi:hypothetical protein